MLEQSKLEDLRRRVDKDPASIAFAQLAEEYRRAGRCEEAIQVCRTGLDIHPGYVSARVTLGRALLELGRLDDAQLELHGVLVVAPDNLAAVRSLAEIFQRRGQSAAALSYYQQALALTGGDRELQQTVADLTRSLAKEAAAEPHLRQTSMPVAAAFEKQGQLAETPAAGGVALARESPLPLPLPERPQSTAALTTDDLERQHALRTIAALEQWLTALNGPGAERHA